MTTSVQTVLRLFDALSTTEQQQTAAAILSRVAAIAGGDLPDELLLANADELFAQLDAEEAQHGQP